MTNYVFLTSGTDGYFSDMYFDDLYNSMILFGNNHYYIVADEKIENIYTMIENFSGWVEDTEDFMDAVGVKVNGNRTAFYKALTGSSRNDDNVCSVLRLITGKEWDCTTLRGCCQGDWIDCFYCPETTSKDFLYYIEAVFFGTGYELGVIECADDIDIENVDTSDVDYWDYTDKWRDDDICKWLGFDPANCVLLEEHKRTVTISSFY